MIRPPHPLHPSLLGETLSTSEALRRGVSADRLRRADIHHPFHGVVILGARPQSTADRAWALAQRMPDDSWFSHSTAAELRGLPLPRSHENGVLHVTVPRNTRALRGAGVAGHQRDIAPPAFESLFVAASSGERVPLRVATVGATLLTASSQLDHADLVALIDAARCRDDDGTRRDIARMLERSARRAGSTALRRAAAQSRAGVRSRPESHLRLLVAAAGLPEPLVAPGVATPEGVLHPDLAWPQFKVLVEYEGDEHRTNARTFAFDIARFDTFVDADWSAVRCTSRDLYRRPRRVLETLARRLRARGWRPARPPRLGIPPIAMP